MAASLYWLTLLPGFEWPARPVTVRDAQRALSRCCRRSGAWPARRLRSAGRRFARAGLMTVVMAGLVVDGWMKPMPLHAAAGTSDSAGRTGERGSPRSSARRSADQRLRHVPGDLPSAARSSTDTADTCHRITTSSASRCVEAIRQPCSSSPVAVRSRSSSAIAMTPAASSARWSKHCPALRELAAEVPAPSICCRPNRASASPLPGCRSRCERQPCRARTSVFDLGESRTVRTIEFPLRWHYPELGARLEVEASRDGVAWQVVSQEWTAGRALAGALEDPSCRTVPPAAARHHGPLSAYSSGTRVDDQGAEASAGRKVRVSSPAATAD